MDYYKHTEEFTHSGFTVIPNIVSDFEQWSKSILRSPDLTRVFVHEPPHKLPYRRGHLKYAAIDRYETDKVLPKLKQFYEYFCSELRNITKLNVITSPYERSAYYCKAYTEKEDEQGWHFDTNGLTVVLYLTTNTSGATEIEPSNTSKLVHVFPKGGTALVLQGRECWHRACPIENEEIKVIILLNYYVDKAQAREPSLDKIIFGR